MLLQPVRLGWRVGCGWLTKKLQRGLDAIAKVMTTRLFASCWLLVADREIAVSGPRLEPGTRQAARVLAEWLNFLNRCGVGQEQFRRRAVVRADNSRESNRDFSFETSHPVLLAARSVITTNLRITHAGWDVSLSPQPPPNGGATNPSYVRCFAPLGSTFPDSGIGNGRQSEAENSSSHPYHVQGFSHWPA
jgi:hypothetical protein